MLTREEITRSLNGAWLLFKGQDAGMRAFDVSVDGFWRSFRVIVLMLPFYLILLYGQRAAILSMPNANPETFPNEAFFFFHMIGIAADWVTYPIVIALIAGPLGFSDRFVPFIVARNWTSLLAIAVYVAPMALFFLGVVPLGVMTFLSIVALVVILRYRYMVTRAALGTPMPLTIGLVVLDFVLNMVMSELIGRASGIG